MLFDKSEIKLDKCILKLSFSDVLLINDAAIMLGHDYNRFNIFFRHYKDRQRKSIARAQDEVGF